MTRWAETADEELLAALSDTQRAHNAIETRMLSLVAEIEARGLAAERGFTHTADLVQTVQRVGSGVAKARVRVARKVTPDRTLQGEELPAPLPSTSEALASAEISYDHAHVIERTLAALPAHLVAHHAETLERDLAEHARVLDPDALRKVGKHALAMLDPDGPRPRDVAPVRNRLRFTERGTGFEARGWFDSESTAVLRTALSPLAAPTGAHESGSCEDPTCDHAAGERLPDPRSAAEREGDGIVELARRMLQVGDLPTENGNRPQVTVTITLDDLRDLRGSGAGLLEAGDGIGRGTLRAEDARRIACDAGIIPTLLGSDSEPVDVGRRHRVVHTALRRALAVRDGGCAFPGCGIPARWTDAHHIRHWAHGGETSLANTVLLCPRHHRLLHHGEWTVEITDGAAMFHPPAWSGAPPGRNILHRPDLIGVLPAPRRDVERVSRDALIG
ncbi:HNH endonuclease signature motif containing protein [Pseudonocardia pini]|uniref:HNH endonuclease signature motif containing protein n=1 Tax=Pseudonocardia pini TaxID=2758030 RepID=UPI0015F07CF6|nr:HNH endonuclease signature motif containing protein [Pseudonocardia pini]